MNLIRLLNSFIQQKVKSYMKILLISPRRDSHVYSNKGILIPQLALFILQGLTPEKHKVKIIEEEYQEIDFNQDCDVVAISCMTSNASRGYKIATAFKERNKTIVMGGIHPTILPDEALQYADAVVIGEAEGVWETVLSDIENNCLQERYHVPDPDLTRYIPKDFSSISKKQMFNLVPVLTTRGCPYNCDFCCVSDIFGKKIKHIPIENAVRDIVESKAKNFIFLDDNIISNRKYARELFNALIPLKINWIGQSSISFANDTEMMKLAAKSGCRGLFIGLESVMENEVKNLKKLSNDIRETEKSLKKIRKMKIIIMASVIFGFDEDTPDIFEKTLKFLRKNRISIASLNILTPYPGTKTFDDLKKQNRLINERWEHYDHHTVVFKPKNMSPVELQVGKINAKVKFFSLSSILARFWANSFSPVYYLASNFGYRKQARLEKKKINEIETLMHQLQSNEQFLNSMKAEKEETPVEVL